jgi:hypothetical protein
MTDFSRSQATPGRVGAGVKLAALVFTLGAIALAADLAWMAPGVHSAGNGATASPVKNERIEGTGYPAPAVPPGAQLEPHIQAF